jgi:predicted exporter
MFLSAVRLDPQNATAYKELAKFYIDTGNKRLEQQTIENALQFASKETLANFDLVSGSVKTNSHLPVLDSIDYHPTIIANFHTIKSILDKRNTRLVCVQYPLRNVQHLKNAFAGESGIIFVDNNDSFRNAIDHSSYDEYFLDRRKNNSGHGTDKGNRLMAENIATAILTEAFQHPLINNGNR